MSIQENLALGEENRSKSIDARPVGATELAPAGGGVMVEEIAVDEIRRIKRRWARRLATDYHLAVLPLHPYVAPRDPTPENLKAAIDWAKVSAIEEWQHKATRDLTQIDAWLAENPDYNWAYLTTGLIGVDQDTKHDGIANWEAIASEHPPLPKTFKVQSWSGGIHTVYRAPLGPDGERIKTKNSRSKIAPGVDIGGDGGYFRPPDLRRV
jgi:Bifunctional DNA primase/polymerase, N-terminal